MSSKERVVVTGVGLVTPLGTDHGSGRGHGHIELVQRWSPYHRFPSHTGNCLAASGALCVAIACLQLNENFIAPVIYGNRLFLEEKLNYVTDAPIVNEKGICLVNSFSHLGENCSLVIRKGK